MKNNTNGWGASSTTPWQDRLISKQEAAGILGVSLRTIERMVSAGALRVIYIRRAVRLLLSEVLKLAGITSELNPSRA